MGQVEEKGSKQNGETHTVCDDATERGSLEVKLNIHVLSLQGPERERETDFASFSCHHPVQEGSVAHSSLSSLHTLPSQTEMCTHKSRGVVVADGRGIAKSCRDEERGSEVAEGRRGTLEKEREEGLPIIVPISDFSGEMRTVVLEPWEGD